MTNSKADFESLPWGARAVQSGTNYRVHCVADTKEEAIAGLRGGSYGPKEGTIKLYRVEQTGPRAFTWHDAK